MKKKTNISKLNISSLMFVLLFCFLKSSNSQNNDSSFIMAKVDINDSALIKTQNFKNQHSPHKATIYSLILPGLGQAYNKKYWKIPVIYGGFATFTYFFIKNQKQYKLFNEAYLYVVNKETYHTDNIYVKKYNDPEILLRGRALYRRNLELNIIGAALWYVLNIIDAAVDAHFFDFDVSDNLSLKVKPDFFNNNNYLQKDILCIKLSLNF